MVRKILLACGIVASVMYAGIDVLAAVRYPAYHSFRSRMISELMASGAPTERLVDPFFILYGPLMIAFGIGLWMSSHQRRAHLTAALLIAYGVVGLPGPIFFEMNLRGTAPGLASADVLHIALTAVLVILLYAAVVAGSAIRGRAFRLYSYATLAIMAVFGVLLGFASRPLAAGAPTPWLGVTERVEVGAFLVWVAVLAIAMLRVRASARPPERPGELLPAGFHRLAPHS